MKNVIALLAATTAISLATSAYAADETSQSKAKVEYKDNGGYESERSAEHVTPGGTKHTTKATVDMDVDNDGKVSKTIETKSETDPKGLMNKETDNAEVEFEEKERGGYKQTTTRKHKDSDGTNVTLVTTTEVDVDAKGNITTTAKTEKTTDPKGLFNKTTTTSVTKSVNGRIVEQKKDVD